MSADDRRRAAARTVAGATVEDFHDRLAEAGATRAFVVHENGEFTLSHPTLLEPVRAFFELSQDFAGHEGVFIGREDGFRTLFLAFVHDTRRGLAQGGLRFKRYDGLADVLVDGLRLAQGMTRKNALAGLWWGGGKGVLPIASDLDRPEFLDPAGERRAALFAAYGRFVASIGGLYYTAEDIGTNTNDLRNVLGANRFTTCVPPSAGGSGNPSGFTARGVLKGMEAAWLYLTGTDDLAGVRVAVQGAGHVGESLIRDLVEAGAQVVFADVDRARAAALERELPGTRAVAPDAILAEDVDIVAPCAIGAVINAQSIPTLGCRLVCGAANNILKEPADAERLRERGILFVPDFVVNRMGITNCADEWRGYLEEDVLIAAERVHPDTLRVLKHARNLAIPTTQAADELADAAATELHPMLGHRGRRIIDHLIESGWAGRGRRATGRRTTPVFRPALDEPPIRSRWEKEGRFRGERPSIAASPISTAAGANLASFLSPLLADVRARSIAHRTGRRPRRVLGSDHGGRALQLAIEESLPLERERYDRPAFVEMCRDRHNEGDATIRDQLRAFGVGFDAVGWLDPMATGGRAVVGRLYNALADAGRVVRETRLVHHCDRCRTALVDSDVVRSSRSADRSYRIRFEGPDRLVVETTTFEPELLLGAVAVVVAATGPYAAAAGRTVVDPVRGVELPVVGRDRLATEAAFLVPAHDLADDRLARELGIEERPVVLDGAGRIVAGGFAGLDREGLREAVLERLGPAVARRPGRWKVEAHRCRRCESMTRISPSLESFVHLEDAAGHLANAIRSGAVRFEPARWTDRVLAHLEALEPWCISRQQWWGHRIPDRPEEVLSTWFSLVAGALEGAGWPADPSPAPIDELFVDPDLLLRWVVPSQLVGLALTGRPVHSTVHVHGRLDTVEVALTGRPDAAEDAPDHERFVYRTVRRPMRRALGNLVQPASLIERFGADALRLGCLLCLPDGFAESATASETRLREARRVVGRLVGKTTGLVALPATDRPPRLGDEWIVAAWRGLDRSIGDALAERRMAAAGRVVVRAVEALAAYARIAAARPVGDRGAIAATLDVLFGTVGRAFEPVCPFAFEAIADRVARRVPPGAPAPAGDLWLADLVVELARRPADRVEIACADRALQARLEADRRELAGLSGRDEPTITDRPADGPSTVVGPCVVVRPGAVPDRIEA